MSESEPEPIIPILFSRIAFHTLNAELEETNHLAKSVADEGFYSESDVHWRLNTSRSQSRNRSGPKLPKLDIPASRRILAEMKTQKSTSSHA